MSTATTTLSSTYSTVDVSKVVDQFTADFQFRDPFGFLVSFTSGESSRASTVMTWRG